MAQRWYISGPMTGLEDWNRPAFDEAESTLEDMGLATFNPARAFPVKEIECWEECIIRDVLHMLDTNDQWCVALLPGWEDSRGARLEAMLAFSRNWPVALYTGDRLSIIPRRSLFSKLRST